MIIRAIIVDDEPLAREGVAMVLEQEADIEIVGQCGDGGAAIRAIKDESPDLVLLDIKMPGLSGFDVVESIGVSSMPAVIFLTAYDEYALRAFRVNAVDYLLKPIDGQLLRDSLQKVRRSLADKSLAERGRQLSGLLNDLTLAEKAGDRSANRIVVRNGGRVYFLRPREISWVEAAGDYVTVHTLEGSHLIRESMKGIQEQLDSHGFQRIHRSSLVNREFIRELAVTKGGDYEVVLKDGTRCRLSRGYRDALFASMKTAPVDA